MDIRSRHFMAGPRVKHMALMLLEAKRWLQQHHPFWDRHRNSDIKRKKS